MDKHELDDSIREYVRRKATGGEIVTGWVLSVSLRHPEIAGSDGYIVDSSSGLPYHSQLGLLMAAMDEKKNIVLSQIINEGE